MASRPRAPEHAPAVLIGVGRPARCLAASSDASLMESDGVAGGQLESPDEEAAASGKKLARPVSNHVAWTSPRQDLRPTLGLMGRQWDPRVL